MPAGGVRIATRYDDKRRIRRERRFWGRPKKDEPGFSLDAEDKRLRDNAIKATDLLRDWMQFYHPSGDPYARP